MIIGNFTYDAGKDTYAGELATLTTGTRKLVFERSDAKADKAPAYRIIGTGKTGTVEFGAAWKKRSEEGRDYLSVKFDDPALAGPINGALLASKEDEGFILVWSRDNRRSKDS